MHEGLLHLISQKIFLSEKDRELCKKHFESVLFPNNRIVEPGGKVPTYLYFVVSGFMRQFHYNDLGDELTMHINCPPGFLTSYTNFINETRSDKNVECITEGELLRITKANLDSLTVSSAALKDFSIWVFQQSIACNESRSKDLLTSALFKNL